jgi:hypothetical protein
MPAETNSPHSTPPKDYLQQMARVAPLCEGKEAIYRESPLYLHVRVERITYSEDGVELQIVPLGTPGFPTRFGPDEVGASWDVLSFSPVTWSAMYVTWTIFFDPEAIRATIDAAQSATCESVEWYTRIRSVLMEARRREIRIRKDIRNTHDHC